MSKHITFEKRLVAVGDYPIQLSITKEGIKIGFGLRGTVEDAKEFIVKCEENIEEQKETIRWVERAIKLYQEEAYK